MSNLIKQRHNCKNIKIEWLISNILAILAKLFLYCIFQIQLVQTISIFGINVCFLFAFLVIDKRFFFCQ